PSPGGTVRPRRSKASCRKFRRRGSIDTVGRCARAQSILNDFSVINRGFAISELPVQGNEIIYAGFFPRVSDSRPIAEILPIDYAVHVADCWAIWIGRQITVELVGLLIVDLDRTEISTWP